MAKIWIDRNQGILWLDHNIPFFMVGRRDFVNFDIINFFSTLLLQVLKVVLQYKRNQKGNLLMNG